MKKRTTRITFESERLLVIRQPTSRARHWCAACDTEVQVVTAEDAAMVADRSLAAICRDIEAAQLHATETGDGLLLVCLNSLLKLK
jgi:hypothetical protein